MRRDQGEKRKEENEVGSPPTKKRKQIDIRTLLAPTSGEPSVAKLKPVGQKISGPMCPSSAEIQPPSKKINSEGEKKVIKPKKNEQKMSGPKCPSSNENKNKYSKKVGQKIRGPKSPSPNTNKNMKN